MTQSTAPAPSAPGTKAPCVPPGATTRTPRKSRATRWRVLTLVLVHVAIALHVLHWMSAGETLSPLEPSESMEYSKNGVVNAGLIFFALSGLATLVFGRFFCGWACHLVLIQDACYELLLKLGIRPKPLRSRLLMLVPFAAFAHIFLQPAFERWYYDLGFEDHSLELTTTGFWDTFPPWPVALATLAIAGFSIIYFLGAKGFCTYACPYGALYGSLDRLAPGRIRVTDACKGCGHCTTACTSDVVVHREVKEFGMVVDSGCMKCLDCVSVCPEDALHFGFGEVGAFASRRQAPREGGAKSWAKWSRWTTNGWGEEVFLFLFFWGAVFSFRGLYDSVPFLFSLGIAGISSFVALRFIRLFYRPRVTLQNLTLRAEGKLTPAGRVFALVALLLFGFQAHSVVVQHHRRALEEGFDALAAERAAWVGAPAPLSGESLEVARGALDHGATLRALAPLELFPREAWRVAIMQGWLALLTGDEQTFSAELARAGRILPNEPAPFEGLAAYHRTMGRPEEALSILREGARAAGRPAMLWLEVAQAEEAAGRPAAALEALEASLASDASLDEARYLRAGLRYGAGDLPGAAEDYEALLARHASDVPVRLQAMLVRLELGELDAAEAHALRARDDAPNAQEPWVALSQIARARGDEVEAERLYAEAVKRAANGAE